MLLYATASYGYLRDEVLRLVPADSGALAHKTFADGERYHRYLDDVGAHEVVLIGGGVSDAETLELLDLACGLVHEGARSLTIVMPYFGYSTMDRAVQPGEVVKAKTRARLISTIPQARGPNRVVLLDLHAEGIQYYFEGGVQAVHLYAKQVVMDAAQELGGREFVLASTDAGRAKWVESLANELGVPASFVFKQRLADGTPVVTALHAAVQGRAVVIYDDMIRSGQTLLNAAQAYRDAGAKVVYCVATHGVLPGDALQHIRHSGLIERIVCTNSHPRALELAPDSDDYLQVRSVANVLATAL